MELNIKKKKGYHFVFNLDCHTHRATRYNYLSFMLFHSFIMMYDEDSGSTMTELISCPNISYKPPWHGKLPKHCHTATVLDYESLDADLKGKSYTPYNKPYGIDQLIKGEWANRDENDVIAIIDPDFLVVKPLPRFWLDTLEKNEIIGGYYQVGSWNKNSKIGGNEVCPHCASLSPTEMETYQTGVPNIMRFGLLKKMVPIWTKATKIIRTAHGDWQDEQLAYIYTIAAMKTKSTLRRDLFISQAQGETSARGFYFMHLCQGITLAGNWRYYKYDFTIGFDPQTKEAIHFYPERSEIYKCDNPPLPEMHYQPAGDVPVVNGWMYVEIARTLTSSWEHWKQLFCGGPRVL